MKTDRCNMLRLLKTARGQLDGILHMIDEDRYCVDISNQILATQSILKKCNLLILQGHMQHCVKEAMQSGKEDEKIAELMQLMEKLSKI